MQPITLLGAGLFAVALYLRYRRRKSGAPRPKRRMVFLAKAILVALLAWLAVSYKLQQELDRIGGTKHEPSWGERIVSSFSGR